MFLKVFSFVLVLLEVLVIFNLIIVVHELGHFLAARWRGLVIEEFGVWFGKPLWRKKFNGVWYSLGSIPAGGFVKLPQLGNKAVEGEAETAELPPLAPLDKIIVAFAGPLFSFLLALALATIVWGVGRPSSQEEETTTIGMVLPGGPAEKAGLKAGDTILAIDGKPVSRFSGPVHSVMWGIMSSEGETIDFLVRHPDGKEEHIASGWVKDPTTGWRRNSLRMVKLAPLIVPEIGGTIKNGAAEAAGLRKGDIVKTVNGKSIYTLDDLGPIIKAAPDAPLELVVDREGQPVSLTLKGTPAPPDAPGRGMDYGIEWGKIIYRYPHPWEQVQDSVYSIRNMVRALFSPKSDVKAQHFSGPIGIMNLYRRILQSEEGWRMAIVFSVLFNVNLALLNMLPLPVLDGGHILLGFIQLVRRKPIEGRVMDWLETGCTLLILGYIVYVSSFDISDFFPGKKGEAAISAPAATPAPATPAPPGP